ncbi:transketolase [bacterium]|nr:transketolase [bacterium]
MIDLYEKALDLRRKVIKTCYLGRGGHIPPSLSALDIMTALYFGGILKYDSKNPNWENRDRFILSKGHAALGIYNVLCDAGFFKRENLYTFCKPGTIFGAHPTPNIPGIEAATGALGHGLSFGVGLALSAKMKKQKHLIYVITGDGECQEGAIWEAAMSISEFKLNNLIWIIDHNKWQATGKVSETMEIEPLDEKMKAFGLEPIVINGHDYKQLINALSVDRNNLPEKPRVIIANTHKGKGVPFIEDKREWHSKIPNNDEFKIIINELGLTEEEFEAL